MSGNHLTQMTTDADRQQRKPHPVHRWLTFMPVWDVEDTHNIHDLVSRYDDPVSFLQMLPKPLSFEGHEDRFFDSRPLLVVHTDGSLLKDGKGAYQNGSNSKIHDSENGLYGPSTVRFYSLTSRSYVHVLKFRTAVYSVRCSGRVVAVSQAAQVTIYRCLEGGTIAVLQSFIDEDKEESFYTVCWACDVDRTPFLVAGGTNGIIRVIDAANEKIHKSYVGHGDSINEIKTQPLNPSLIVSASKDESVRLWNVHTGICILIFDRAGGHRNEVLSVDFHPSDEHRIASCGMDNTVKIWSMKGNDCGTLSYQ